MVDVICLWDGQQIFYLRGKKKGKYPTQLGVAQDSDCLLDLAGNPA